MQRDDLFVREEPIVDSNVPRAFYRFQQALGLRFVAAGIPDFQVQKDIRRIFKFAPKRFNQAERIFPVQIAGYIEDIAKNEDIIGKLKMLPAEDRLLVQAVHHQRHSFDLQRGQCSNRLATELAGGPNLVDGLIDVVPVRADGRQFPQPIPNVERAI